MIRADLHIHSCLSPCGDDGMTPADLVGLSLLNGLDVIALTDHNSCKNCPAAFAAAQEYGIGFVPGAEVTTSEDIHCVCLLPTLEAAMAFDAALEQHLPPIPNRREIFGNQILISPDGTCGEYPNLLISATDLSIIDLPDFAAQFGGICYPAHVDREANGLFSILGTWPEDLHVKAAEIRFCDPGGLPAGIPLLQGSDAHRLEDLPDDGFPTALPTPDFAGILQYIGM